MNDIRKGEKWYIKMRGAVGVWEAEILGITIKTVSLRDLSTEPYSGPRRYAIEDLVFLEKVNTTG